MSVERLAEAVYEDLAFEAVATLAGRKAEAQTSRPVWSREVNDTTLTIIEHRVRDYTSYELIGVDERDVSLGRFSNFPAATAEVSKWTHFIEVGGSVGRWLAHYATDCGGGQVIQMPTRRSG
ncbi:hypothetical protein [Mycobacterium montefiorense]|uniref:hypothetical protein n=1 Tax=Mycobacterium montefiorense TaxID=154654 RepID=UPI0021DDE835|nr:hypothetical protein [Mycobacterium montefiorense]MCV7428253.1 hypothetical protein [Mycobacterium montefiorense]GLE51985.1 hypothetical protein ATCCBAA256_15610 [Mycobacterium montefiorense]